METENLSFVAIVGLVAVVAVVALLGNQGTTTVTTPTAATTTSNEGNAVGNAIGGQCYGGSLSSCIEVCKNGPPSSERGCTQRCHHYCSGGGSVNGLYHIGT